MERKTALITGATSGIGASFAQRFARDGYDLILTGRREEVIRERAEALEKTYGAGVEVHILELTDVERFDAFLEEISRRDVDVLVNNAGFGLHRDFHRGKIGKWEAMLDVHAAAPLKLIHAVVPKMLEKGEGTIINVSSISAFLPLPKTSVYSSTKSFITVFSEALDFELGDRGIRVQSLCPGFTHTDFHSKMSVDKRKLAHLHWMSAEKVVDTSLSCIGRRKVVCIPGFRNRAMVFFLKLIPRKVYARLARRANR